MRVSKGCRYQVTNPKAPYQAVDPGTRALAEAIRATVEAQVPRDTGEYAGAWSVQRVRPATYWVTNDSPHARFVEYGTRFMAARPVFGQVIAAVRNRVGR